MYVNIAVINEKLIAEMMYMQLIVQMHGLLFVMVILKKHLNFLKILSLKKKIIMKHIGDVRLLLQE
jgi:hypothetical protein